MVRNITDETYFGVAELHSTGVGGFYRLLLKPKSVAKARRVYTSSCCDESSSSIGTCSWGDRCGTCDGQGESDLGSDEEELVLMLITRISGQER